MLKDFKLHAFSHLQEFLKEVPNAKVIIEDTIYDEVFVGDVILIADEIYNVSVVDGRDRKSVV